MRSFCIELFLESELIQTATASSLGVHHSLDYIRGSSLLGVAASRCYEKLGDDAFTVFHSGQVRFGDAQFVSADGSRMWPVSLGWLTPKRGNAEKDGQLDAAQIYSIAQLDAGQVHKLQLQSMRGGYFAHNGGYAQMKTSYRLKTAIDRKQRGRAKESSLYGYESLAAGTTWRAMITIDDEVDPGVDEALKAVFDQQTLWLGRSRGAEYGRTRSKIVEQVAEAEPDDTVLQLTIACLSDIALASKVTGLPTCLGQAHHFELPNDWTLVTEASSVTSRRFSPFNGKRRYRDLERVVVGRGSVLTFKGSTEVKLSDIRTKVLAGVGGYRQEGLGQVEVSPWYLNSEHPNFRAAPVQAGERKVPRPNEPLANWMVRRASERTLEDDAAKKAHEMAETIVSAEKRLRKNHKPVPSVTQWNQLAGIARSHLYRSKASKAALRETLAEQMFATAEGARGVGSNAWRGEVGRQTLSELTLDLSLDKFDDDRTAILCLYHLARSVRGQSTREREQD